MKKTLLALLSVFVLQAKAQPPSYQWHNSANYISTVTKFDNQGNIITAGLFTGIVDFDPSSTGTFTLNSANGGLFISKLDANGNFVFACNFGSTSIYSAENNVTDICTTSNNYILTGHFIGNADFDPSPVGTNTLACGTNNTNAFVLYLYDDLEYQTSFAIGGSGAGNNDYSNSIACDANDEIIITGSTKNISPSFIDFDPSASTATVANFGGIFVAKYTNSGIYQWAQIYAGTGTLLQEGKAVFTSSANNDILVMGSCSGNPDFDFSASTYTVPSSNAVSVFYLKLNANGGFISANTISGNSNVELSHASASHDFSNIMTVVRSSGNNCDTDPSATNTNTISLPILGQGALFTQKLNSNLNLVWANVISGQGNAFCLATNTNNYVFTKNLATRYSASGSILWNYNLSNNNGVFGKGIFSNNSTDLYLTGELVNDPINYNPMATTPVASEQGTSVAKTFLTKWQETGNNGFYLGSITQPTVCANELVTIVAPQTAGNGTLTLTGPGGWPTPPNFGIGTPFSLAGLTTYPNTNAFPPFTVTYTDGISTLTNNFFIVIQPTLGIGSVATPTVGNSNNTIEVPYSNQGSFSWVSCPSYSLAANQPNVNSNNVFTPLQNGSYAAIHIVANTGCKDTSACVSFNLTTSINEFSENPFTIYPNPTSNILRVSSQNSIGLVSIVDVLSKTVYKKQNDEKDLIIDISFLQNGIYFITVNGVTKKIIKE